MALSPVRLRRRRRPSRALPGSAGGDGLAPRLLGPLVRRRRLLTPRRPAPAQAGTVTLASGLGASRPRKAPPVIAGAQGPGGKANLARAPRAPVPARPGLVDAGKQGSRLVDASGKKSVAVGQYMSTCQLVGVHGCLRVSLQVRSVIDLSTAITTVAQPVLPTRTSVC